MGRNPDLVYIPSTLIDDKRLGDRDRAALMHLIALADDSARCEYDREALAGELGVTIRTLRKRLARLEGLGYVVDHGGWVEMHEDLVLADDCEKQPAGLDLGRAQVEHEQGDDDREHRVAERLRPAGIRPPGRPARGPAPLDPMRPKLTIPIQKFWIQQQLE